MTDRPAKFAAVYALLRASADVANHYGPGLTSPRQASRDDSPTAWVPLSR